MGRKRDLVSKTASKLAWPVKKVRSEKYQGRPRLAILMFHRILDEPVTNAEMRDMNMSVQVFRKYCEYFKERSQICTLHEGLERMKKGEGPYPLVVFSFDDGYGNFYQNAFPVLKELGIKANQNIIARYADEGAGGYMNWAQIWELRDSGLVEIGCHTYAQHYLVEGEPALARASEAEVLADLERARESFLANLGEGFDIVAWPYGVPPKNVSTEKLRELGVKFQLNTVSGMNFSPMKLGDLKRFAALGFEEPEKLGAIIDGYDDLGFLLGR